MKKIIIILVIFAIDRLTKIYLINLQSSGIEIDFYVSFLIKKTGVKERYFKTTGDLVK